MVVSYNQGVAAWCCGGCECNSGFFSRGHNGKSEGGRCLERSVGGEDGEWGGWAVGIGCGVHDITGYVRCLGYLFEQRCTCPCPYYKKVHVGCGDMECAEVGA